MITLCVPCKTGPHHARVIRKPVCEYITSIIPRESICVIHPVQDMSPRLIPHIIQYKSAIASWYSIPSNNETLIQIYFKHDTIRTSYYIIPPVKAMSPSLIPNIFQYIVSNAKHVTITYSTHLPIRKHNRKLIFNLLE